VAQVIREKETESYFLDALNPVEKNLDPVHREVARPVDFEYVTASSLLPDRTSTESALEMRD